MSFTELIGELVIIGAGATCWLGLVFATAIKYIPTEASFQPFSSALFIAIIATITYVLGVVTDRLSRKLFSRTIEARAQRAIINAEKISEIKRAIHYIKDENISIELEHFIRSKSDMLGKRIDYNRSRLRICRAWSIHFLLIGFSFLAWNVRTTCMPWPTAAALFAICIGLALLTLYTAYHLALDHQYNLIESFRILTGSETAVNT